MCESTEAHLARCSVLTLASTVVDICRNNSSFLVRSHLSLLPAALVLSLPVFYMLEVIFRLLWTQDMSDSLKKWGWFPLAKQLKTYQKWLMTLYQIQLIKQHQCSKGNTQLCIWQLSFRAKTPQVLNSFDCWWVECSGIMTISSSLNRSLCPWSIFTHWCHSSGPSNPGDTRRSILQSGFGRSCHWRRGRRHTRWRLKQ